MGPRDGDGPREEARCTAGKTGSSSHTANSPNPEQEGGQKKEGEALSHHKINNSTDSKKKKRKEDNKYIYIRR